MNQTHLELCSSAEWADAVERWIIPWALDSVDLGDDALEIGPGPGLTTDVLRRGVGRLTAVEVDPDLAQALARRLAGTNVDVRCADATATGLPGDRFSSAVCLTMLHHVPTIERQDALFGEVLRLLRPGGVFAGQDSLASDELRALHIDDTYVPVDPATLAGRLGDAGFADVVVDTNEYGVRFRGRKRSAERGG
ncbi:MAG: class I SAM-dependent methyltransferase [Acidimicrobiales bacterium]